MENVKDKISFVIVVIVATIIFGVAFYFMEFNEDVYYTQVDNSKIQKITSSDNMKYKYNLNCYKESGREKELEFKTSRELKEDAYLKLTVKSVSGVNNWEEVQYNELPEKVKANYTKK